MTTTTPSADGCPDLRSWIGRALVRSFLNWHRLVMRVLSRRRPRGKCTAPVQDVLLTGMFYSDNWILNHLKPLSLSDATGTIRLVCSSPIPETPKVKQIIPPRWLARLIGRTPSRLLFFFCIGLRHRPDVVGGFHLIVNGLAAAALARLTRARAVYFCGGGPREVADGGIHGNPVFARLLGRSDPVVEKKLIRAVGDFDLVVTMGSRAADYFREQGVRTRFAAIPGGIDPGRYTCKSGKKCYDLIIVGRLDPVKRHDIFLETVALLRADFPSIRAAVVGAGERGPALREKATQLGIAENVVFTGHQANVAPWLKDTKVFVLTSESEGLSLALMEAMMCGLPCVVSDVGELGDLVAEGENGFLVENHASPAAFADRLKGLLGDDELRQGMSRAARQSVARFEVTETAKQWTVILRGDDSSKPSICIVSHNAYGAISGGHSGFIGGVEWQTSLTAKWLAGRGYDVSLLTWDEGGDREETIGGVRVIKVCRQKGGLWGLRFFHPKWTGLTEALSRANPDICYHNCAECTSGQIALWCRRHQRRFVFCAANNADCDGSLPELGTLRERVLYRYGLRSADRRIVQTEHQRQLLQRDFGLEATVIPMPCPTPPADSASGPPWPPGRILWVARVCYQKRPDRLLDLAEQCPDLAFDLVGPFYSGSYAREVRERAERLPNVTAHGPVPREDVYAFYAGAGCLCCTSDLEGFPNTFLEAWSHGLPVVSTYDPDNLIQTRGLGSFAQDATELERLIRRLFSSEAEYREVSTNARRYYRENHAAEAVLPRFEQVFLDTLRAGNAESREGGPA